MNSNPLAKIESSSELMFEVPVNEMSLQTAVISWSLLDHIDKVITARKTEFRDRFFKEAEEKGNKDSKGTYKLEVDDGKITKQNRQSVKLDNAKIEKLCKSKNIPLDNAGKMVFEAEDTKVLDLIAKNILTAEEVEAASIIKSSYALLIDKPLLLKQQLEGEINNGKFSYLQSRVLSEE